MRFMLSVLIPRESTHEERLVFISDVISLLPPQVEHNVGDVANRLRARGPLRHRPPEGAQPPGRRHQEEAQLVHRQQGGRREVRRQLGGRRQRREQGAQERVSNKQKDIQ